jgi:hypothetical protein
LAVTPCGFPSTCENGGGVFNQGILTLTHSILYNNTAQYGAAVYSSGNTDTDLVDSVVMENLATQFGGGIYHADDFLLLRTKVITNEAVLNGGGVYNVNADSLVIIDSHIAANTAGGNGGGIYIQGGIISKITTSTIWNNMAANGGGLYNSSGTIEIRNSTFSQNVAVGTGGGFHNNTNISTIHAFNVTLVANSAKQGGGIYSRQFGLVVLTNSLVADSPNGGDCAVSPGTSIGDGSFNIIEDGSCLPWTASPDPMLGPLQDNGGETITHALLSGSPAIDKNIDCINAEFTDQRQIIRPKGAGCDIGAYESIIGSFAEFFVYLPLVLK